MFKFFLYKIGQFLVNILPMSISYKIAKVIADLHYFFSLKDRQAVKNNLKFILSPSDNISLKTKEVFRNFGYYLVEFFRMKKITTKDYLEKNVEIENLGAIERALEKGKGAIVITAHIGNWELGAVILSYLGFPLSAIALPHKERPVNDFFNQQREFLGVNVIPANIAVRRSMETLKENKLIALVGDRVFGMHGEVLNFLGNKALIPKGPAVFAEKTGAALIPGFLTRKGGGTFHFSLGDPIFPPMTSEKESSHDVISSLMKQYVAIIENEIYENPTQWLMFRKFWVEGLNLTPASI